MGFDDCSLWRQVKGNKVVGVGGAHEKPHKSTVFAAISAFFQRFLLPWGRGPKPLMLMIPLPLPTAKSYVDDARP